MSDIKDNVLRQWITSTIRNALNNYLGGVLSVDEREEVWLDKTAFLKQFGQSPSWFDKNCQYLPRQRAEGAKWVYPRNKIQAMFKDGRIRRIVSDYRTVIDDRQEVTNN